VKREELEPLWECYEKRWDAGEREELRAEIINKGPSTNRDVHDHTKWFFPRFKRLMHEMRIYFCAKREAEELKLQNEAYTRHKTLRQQYQPTVNADGDPIK
jgi:hypothetical protein